MAITKEGLFKYQALGERQRKNLLILNAILKNGPVSKTVLSRQLGYNIVTLSNHMEEFIKKGVVFEKGFEGSSGGRPPAVFELNRESSFLIGVDFGKDALRGLVADFALNVIYEAKSPPPQIEQEDVEKCLIKLIDGLINGSKVDAAKVRFIAVGTYGIIGERNGTIKGLDEEKGRSRATVYFKALKQIVEKRFNTRAFFGQDATLAAFGEKAKNPSADVDNMLYIFGDVGKGVVIKGEVYCGTDFGSVDLEGVTGALSEEEKMKIREESLYLKPWNSQMDLKNEALRVIERGVGTKIIELLKGELKDLSDEVIMKAALEKDEIAIELIENIGINLGVRIAYLINLFSPNVIIIGGGIERAGDILFAQIDKTIDKLSLEKSKKSVKILPSVLGERAVSLGAASVALREAFLET